MSASQLWAVYQSAKLNFPRSSALGITRTAIIIGKHDRLNSADSVEKLPNLNGAMAKYAHIISRLWVPR